MNLINSPFGVARMTMRPELIELRRHTDARRRARNRSTTAKILNFETADRSLRNPQD